LSQGVLRLPTSGILQIKKINYFDTIPLLRVIEKLYFGEKNTFPIVLISYDEILAKLKYYKKE
jgi:hypothetical protein